MKDKLKRVLSRAKWDGMSIVGAAWPDETPSVSIIREDGMCRIIWTTPPLGCPVEWPEADCPQDLARAEEVARQLAEDVAASLGLVVDGAMLPHATRAELIAGLRADIRDALSVVKWDGSSLRGVVDASMSPEVSISLVASQVDDSDVWCALDWRGHRIDGIEWPCVDDDIAEYQTEAEARRAAERLAERMGLRVLR